MTNGLHWLALAPMFVGLVLGRFFRSRALQRLSPLGANHRARAWWLRWAVGREYYSPDGWRDQMRALWVPAAGVALSLALIVIRAWLESK